MNGIHEMGGMHGFGPVTPADNEATFHDEWERRVFGLYVSLVSQGCFAVDEHRHAVERIDPASYLSSSYYGCWLAGIETLLVEKDLVTAAEIQAATEAGETPADEEAPKLTEAALSFVYEGESTECAASGHPRFEPGESVRVRNHHPDGHTRCPRYARRATGVVSDNLGSFSLPDTIVGEEHERAEPLYSVRFTHHELWGPDHPTDDYVYLDLWESYLAPASHADDPEEVA